MLTLGRKGIIYRFLWLIALLSFQLFAQVQDNNQTINKNIELIEHYYQKNSESLPDQTIVQLAHNIISQRTAYNSDIVAKAFVLLAETASNKGDMATAFQFAQDGLQINPTKPDIGMRLHLKLAAANYTRGKFQLAQQHAEQVLAISDNDLWLHYRLYALAYRSMTYALMAKPKLAQADLKQLQQLMSNNQAFSEHIHLLEIIAVANIYLGNYHTAIDLDLHILKLRFQLKRFTKISQTYANLASAYRRLGRYDDAYNAYWEAKKYAEQQNANINLAYALLGLGEVLITQQNYGQAYIYLTDAEQLFNGKNLPKPYLSTLIALADAAINIGEQERAKHLLNQALKLASSIELTIDQANLYRIASKFNEQNGQFERALAYLQKYQQLVEKFQPLAAVAIKTEQTRTQNENANLSLALAYDSELKLQYVKKFDDQQQLISILGALVLTLTIVLIVAILKNNKRTIQYHTPELKHLTSPFYSKKMYQQAYKQARYFQYDLALAYLKVENWSELEYLCSKRTCQEVRKTIAHIIDSHIGEFDQAALLNDGEYIVVFPHQTEQDAYAKVQDIGKALQANLFANLGDFTLNIHYALESPIIQDIDPFLFLSKLAEATTRAKN